jgi:hypothetical protein
VQLEQLVEHIESAFGDDLPPAEGVSAEDRAALQRVFNGDDYQEYLQDQVNRQIIRDYLTNAVVLGHATLQALDHIAGQVATREGRSSLSLYMLMSSVEEAGDLLAHGVPSRLEQLKPDADSRPHIHLIQS